MVKCTFQEGEKVLPMFLHKMKHLWRPSHGKQSCSPSRRSTRVYILEWVLLNCVLYSTLLALTNVIFCSHVLPWTCERIPIQTDVFNISFGRFHCGSVCHLIWRLQIKSSLFSSLLKGKCSVKHETLSINKAGKAWPESLGCRWTRCFARTVSFSLEPLGKQLQSQTAFETVKKIK